MEVCFEWNEIKQDLKALKQVEIEESGKRGVLRTEYKGAVERCFRSSAHHCLIRSALQGRWTHPQNPETVMPKTFLIVTDLGERRLAHHNNLILNIKIFN